MGHQKISTYSHKGGRGTKETQDIQKTTGNTVDVNLYQ